MALEAFASELFNYSSIGLLSVAPALPATRSLTVYTYMTLLVHESTHTVQYRHTFIT